jgi:hypothetical protein
MSRFVQSEERTQETFLPCRLEDYVTEENPVRVIDVFVEQLDLDGLGFARMQPEATGRPARAAQPCCRPEPRGVLFCPLCVVTRSEGRYAGNPGTNSWPVSNLIVEPINESPTGSVSPSR